MVAGEPLPDEDLLGRLADAGAGTVRFNLGWAVAQPEPGPISWRVFDDLVAGAAARGIRVLPTVYGSPRWVAEVPEEPPLGPGDLTAFEAFVRAAAGRYGQGGTLWRERRDVEPLPVREWQLWNEPNAPLYWRPRPDAGQYLALLRAFDRALEEADPGARVVLGGLFPTPKGGVTSDRFLTELHGAGADRLLDAVAIHPYAGDPQRAMDSVRHTRRILDSLGAPDTPIWVTEIGWASAGVPSAVTVGPERQAQYLTETFDLAAEEREDLGIGGVLWYSLTDLAGDHWPSHSGLITLEGEDKPAWDALAGLELGEG